MKNATIAFIGAGNMGQSLIGGLIADGYQPGQIWATEPHQDKLDALHKNFGVNVTTDNNTAVAQADIVLLAVKPQVMSEVVKGIAQTMRDKKPLIISIAAGIRIAYIQKWLGEKAAVVRCMPNTPALVGSGATALLASHEVSEEQKELAESILRSVGITLWLDQESQMDIVTALSGSGPAYFFFMMEALQAGAVKLGLSEEVARMLTVQTGLGAAHMALETAETLAELRQKVTSPGGTTEAALKVLESVKLRDGFIDAVQSAKSRSEELAKLFGENE